MTKTLAVIFVASLAVSSSACGGIHDFPMSDSLAAIDFQLTLLEAGLGPHADAINNAADMGAINDGEHDHDSRVTMAHDAMKHEVDDMVGCHSGGELADATALRAAVASLGQEFENHAASMAAAADVTAAHAEESRHQGVVAGLINSVRAQRDSMASGAGDYMCDGHGH